MESDTICDERLSIQLLNKSGKESVASRDWWPAGRCSLLKQTSGGVCLSRHGEGNPVPNRGIYPSHKAVR